jgi:exosortase
MGVITGELKPRAVWRAWHAVAAAALVGAAVFAGWEVWRDIWNYARYDEESSQILLVPIVVAWIAWVRREALAECRPAGRIPGAAMVGLGWLIHTVGNRWQIQTFWHGGAVLMATGALVTVVGQGVLWRLLPAFGALVFLLPVPATGRHLLAYPLQTVTAHATQVCGEALGMSVERAGNLLSINGNNVAIAEACNGMRMVFTLFLVCYTFAFTTTLPNSVRALVLVSSPAVAVVCNVIRLVPTVYVFGHYSKETGEMFHDVGGWVMLVVGYLLLMGIVRLVRWVAAPAADEVRKVMVVRGGAAH